MKKDKTKNKKNKKPVKGSMKFVKKSRLEECENRVEKTWR